MDAASSRFARFPGESVTLCGESVGLQISQEIEDLLVEDVSYRARQIAHIACQFMHHVNRTHLCTGDIDKALKWTNVEPVYGHSSSSVPNIQLVNEAGLYTIVDKEVTLTHEAQCNPLQDNIDELVSPLEVSATWLSVEWQSLLNDQGEITADNGAVIEIKSDISEAQYGYLSLLVDGVSGDREDIRQVALHDLQFSTVPANVLPFLFQYIQETVMSWKHYSPLQLVRFLRMVIALFRNQALFLDPYTSTTLTLLHSVIMDSTSLPSCEMYTHWHVRELTACAIAEIIRKCSNPLSDYEKDLLSSFTQVLSSHQSLSHPVTFGVVFTLCYLGGKGIAVCLLPVLAPLAAYIQEQLEKSSPSTQQDALRVYNTILMAAEILLLSSHGLVNELAQQSSVFQQVLAPESLNNSSIEISLDASEFTLYEFLVELFGERLLLMLEARKRCSKNQTASVSEPSTCNQTASEFFGTNLQSCIDEAFRRQQMREGFVSLHHLVSSQRLVIMKKPVPSMSMSCHPFCIRMYRLPIMHNVLELSSSPMRSQGNQTSGRINRGKLKRKRRNFSTLDYTCCNTGVGTFWL